MLKERAAKAHSFEIIHYKVKDGDTVHRLRLSATHTWDVVSKDDARQYMKKILHRSGCADVVVPRFTFERYDRLFKKGTSSVAHKIHKSLKRLKWKLRKTGEKRVVRELVSACFLTSGRIIGEYSKGVKRREAMRKRRKIEETKGAKETRTFGTQTDAILFYNNPDDIMEKETQQHESEDILLRDVMV